VTTDISLIANREVFEVVISITRQAFNEAIGPMVTAVVASTLELISQQQLVPDATISVGGCFHIPFLQRSVISAFRERVCASDPTCILP
jgi:molecular chaperone DnaK (HSP70)